MKIAVIGAGLAGLTAAIMLARQKKREVILIEKKTFPFHRVCGEYLSMEVVPFLEQEGLLPKGYAWPIIKRFTFTGTGGKGFTIPLDLGGIGISRYVFDSYLWELAKREGVQCISGVEVEEVNFEKEGNFEIQLSNAQQVQVDYVLGAFGKKSRIDISLQRPHLNEDQGYVGIKYHMLTDVADDVVELHNFEQGYCGVSRIEEGKTNVCYLTTRQMLRKYGKVADLEEQVLYRNPELKKYFVASEHLWEKPVVISDFGFSSKKLIENHVLMLGDAAGLVTPLCGNGMAMAIRAGVMAAEALRAEKREEVEAKYTQLWNAEFKLRLKAGRTIQGLFGKPWVSNVAAKFPALGKILMPLTHGEEMNPR
jgi:flavin-dependent dehydrogenase